MPNALKIASLPVLMFLFDCSAQQFSAPRPVGLKLLPPDEVSVAVLLKQKVTLQTGERQQQFLVVARFQQHRLELVVLSPTGQKLLTLDYDGENLVQDTLSSIDLRGKEILAIIQFALWPEHSINIHYPKKDGWVVEIAPEKRILFTASGMLLKISYQADELIVDNHIQDYRVIVHTLERTEI